MHRRKFIENLTKASVVGIIPIKEYIHPDLLDPIVDENDISWEKIADAYPQDGYINLRSLWTGLSPNFLINSFKKNTERLFSNDPNDLRYKGQTYFDKQLKAAKKTVAKYFHSKPEEIAFTRNTTEGLMNVIFGVQFKPGDEIIISDHEYSLVKGSLDQLKAQKKVVINQIKLPLNPSSKNDLIEPFKRAITKNTKAIFCCHVYLSGIVFPVKELKEAVGASILVAVDGALAVGNLDLNLAKLGCDFYAGSFHKGFGTPRGMGFLYMKEEHIASTWPLFGHYSIFKRKSGYQLGTIHKFETYGQFPDYQFVLVSELISFYQIIGKESIEKRLKFLKNYWTDKVKGHVKFITPTNDMFSNSLITFQVKGKTPKEIEKKLLERKILVATTMIDALEQPEPSRYNANVLFINVSIFNTTEQLDFLTDNLLEII